MTSYNSHCQIATKLRHVRVVYAHATLFFLRATARGQTAPWLLAALPRASLCAGQFPLYPPHNVRTARHSAHRADRRGRPAVDQRHIRRRTLRYAHACDRAPDVRDLPRQPRCSLACAIRECAHVQARRHPRRNVNVRRMIARLQFRHHAHAIQEGKISHRAAQRVISPHGILFFFRYHHGVKIKNAVQPRSQCLQTLPRRL